MKNIGVVTREIFLLLKRDGVFFLFFLFSFFSLFFANLAVSSSLNFSKKLFFDVGLFCYHFLGLFVAFFWGNKILSDSFAGGSLACRLSLGICRRDFFLGAFFALCMVQLLVGFFYIVLWQGVMHFLGFSWLGKALFLFYSQTLLWFVLAAVSFFWSSFLSFNFSLLGSLLVWFLGMTSKASFEALQGEDVNLVSRGLSFFLSSFWDLSVFNIQYFDLSDHKLLISIGARLFLQAASIVFVFLSLGNFLFQRRDIG